MNDLFNKNYEIKNIKYLENIINKFLLSVSKGEYTIDDMIIVFDIDDTLSTVNLSNDYYICIYNHFIKKESFNEHELDNLEYGILMDKIPCEESTINILNMINHHNINQIVVTSRTRHLEKATLINFEKMGMLKIITDNKFYNSNNESINFDKLSIYIKNILMVSDQPKGLIFYKFLNLIGKSFKIIIVVDNTLDKINSFYEPFRNKSNIIGLLYTFIDSSSL